MDGQLTRWYGPQVRRAGTALALGLACATLPACLLQRGHAWDEPSPSLPAGDAEGPISVIAIGDPVPGPTAKRVARRVDELLASEREAGRVPIVVWLGDNVFPSGPTSASESAHPTPGCLALGESLARPGVDALASTVRRFQASGGHAFAVLGDRDWRCGEPDLEFTDEVDPAIPWLMPDYNYVVALGRDGAARIASACEGSTCSVGGGGDVQLVMLDVTPWIHQPAADAPHADAAEHSLSQLNALVGALEASREDAPPRILITHIPIESSGYHGQGGGKPDATFYNFPPALKDALQSGLFAGVVSGHERSLQATADVGYWVKRTAKVWFDKPVFQVVSGAAGHPDALAPFTPKQLPYFNSIAIQPDAETTRAGFAQLVFDRETATIVLHAKAGRKWRSAAISSPLRPEPHPAESPSPVMTPCLHCDPKVGASDGTKW